MTKVHNFSAGPSILPQEAIQACVEGIQNFSGTGLSLLEVSHRGKEFVRVVEEAQATIKELMDIPEGYEILFLGGGASMQFATISSHLIATRWRRCQVED
jgi:phosphoserine aminotransferase